MPAPQIQPQACPPGAQATKQYKNPEYFLSASFPKAGLVRVFAFLNIAENNLVYAYIYIYKINLNAFLMSSI
jgi:hypothetical protein